MYTCIHIYTYTFLFFLHIFKFSFLHFYIFTFFTCIHICIFTFLHIYIFTYLHIDIFTHLHIRMQIDFHIQIDIYKCIYIYICLQIHILPSQYDKKNLSKFVCSTSGGSFPPGHVLFTLGLLHLHQRAESSFGGLRWSAFAVSKCCCF